MPVHSVPLRVLSVFGTRPEAIKMAPVIRAVAARPDAFTSLVCVTGQHRDMLDQIMRVFKLAPDIDLDIMRAGQVPSEVASRVLAAMPAVFRDTRPDLVLVQGDTTTTMATSMAAFLHGIPIGHIEAGLRTDDIGQPFPEEMNRRVTSLVTALHFPPTRRAQDALLREGVRADRIIVTGNTVIDALLQSRRADYRFSIPALAALDPTRRIVLVTLHRRESFGAPMRSVCAALRQIAERHPDLTFVLPMHRNPSVRDVVLPALGGSANFVLIEPLDYLDFIHLMSRSFLIVTDSGGVQEEAPALDIPVLVTRDVTERPEGVEVGAARLVGTDEARIVQTLEELLTDAQAYRKMAAAPNPYGDGRASERIVAAMLKWADTAAAA
jgi:UDP-N-acetylglucosamine 2-epimerase (non-hydrolysing)/UDP-N-acetylglucosamine 2-epimerase (hydrolysing)